MRILHLTADFPDPFGPRRTRAVANLLDLVPEHDHQVYSLTRISRLAGITALAFGPGRRAIAYGAPPRGVLMARRLSALAEWIVADVRARDLSPDLVHAHKLSVEGLAGAEVARALGVPLVVSSQGNSDLRILSARPDLRGRWRRIWQEAAHVLPFAPWTADALSALLGPRDGPLTCLPCPTPSDRMIAPRIAPPRVLAAFGLDGADNKNAALLIEAVRILRSRGHPADLEIAGGGSAAAFARLSRQAAGLPFVRLLGPIRHDRLQDRMNGAACLAVPSRRESYGMVFAEALLAGCPVLHGHGNGISGYFPGAPFAVGAPRGGAEALARALGVMLQAQRPIKAALAAAQEAGELDLLRRPAIARAYRDVLDGAVPVAAVAA